MLNKLLQNVTTAVPTYGETISVPDYVDGFTVQYSEAGTGAITATIVTYVSNDGTNWLTLATTTLSGTTTASDGFTWIAPWKFVRAGVTAISAGATINGIINWLERK